MITGKVTQRVLLPHEPGEWIEVRMPSLNILNRARQAKLRQTIEAMQGIDLDLVTHYGTPGTETAAPADPADAYDVLTLLKSCITGWSYDDEASIDENIDELDEETVTVVVRALLPVISEAERKNVFARSISP